MSRRMLVNLKNVSVHLHDDPLFEKLSFSLHRGELIALVGANGCGKSTILNLLKTRCTAGSQQNDGSILRTGGEIFTAPGIDVVSLPQSLRSFPEFSQLPNVGDSETTFSETRLLREFDLQIGNNSLDRLSDGELQKWAIIHTLIGEYDLYLYDEPTNYLDIAGITAFEHQMERLKNRGKGIVLVSHDRMLSDRLADRAILVTPHGIYHAAGGATRVWSVRHRDITSRRKQAKQITKKIQQLQDDMRAKTGWAAQKEKQKIGAGSAKAYIGRMSKKMAKRAKVMQRRVEQETERLTQAKPFVPKMLNLSFPPYEIRTRNVFSLQNVCFRYGRSPGGESDLESDYLLEKVNLSASTRDRICLMGTNGSGKSTLIEIARGRFGVTDGTRYINERITTSYVPQGLIGFFGRERLVDNFAGCGDESAIRQYLGAALIRKEKARDLVANFSYGELMRAAIVKCILKRAEFLFLDEPTSHLDIESIEVLEELLADFHGGFLLVSHDRTFVERVAETLYVLDQGQLRLV